MESKRTNLIIAGVVGLVLGLLLGMLLFWVAFPVKWTNAHSYDLAPEAKAEYVVLVADSFKLDKDPARAAKYFEAWTPQEKEQAFADSIATYTAQGRPDKVLNVTDLAMVLGVALPGTTPTPVTTPQPAPGIWDRIRVPCLVFFVVLLILVLGWL